MKKVITLEIGNSSWWKNRKYRREAALEIRKLREKNSKVRLLKKYQTLFLNIQNIIKKFSID